MDKSWIGKPKNTSEYKRSLTQFLDFAFMNGMGEADEEEIYENEPYQQQQYARLEKHMSNRN